MNDAFKLQTIALEVELVLSRRKAVVQSSSGCIRSLYQPKKKPFIKSALINQIITARGPKYQSCVRLRMQRHRDLCKPAAHTKISTVIISRQQAEMREALAVLPSDSKSIRRKITERGIRY